MKKSLLLLFVFLMTVTAHAQFRLFNSPPLSTNNGSSGASFNMRANSSVFIDTFFVPLYGTIGSTTTVEVWYNTTPNNGTIPNMANPGWTQIVSSPGVPILSSGFSGITQFAPVVIPGGFLMNAGDHFAFALGRATTATGSMAYTNWVAGSLDTFTDGNLTMYTGSGIGYGGAWPNLNIASRQFTGGLSYRVAAGLDLRPSALISPIPPVAGSNTFTFRFQNAASDPVTSGDLGLMVDNNPPVFLNGYTFTGLGNPGGVENVTFPTSFTLNAGSSVLVKVWGKNANGLGPDSNPNNDTLTLNLTVPGVVISIASGNWSSPSTWNVGRAPNVLDTVIVSTGHTVTSDLANQTCAKLTVDGIFTFGATPADFRIMSDLQVNAGGLVNVFQGTTGKILRIGGNLTNNGRINNSIGTTAVGTINLFGSSMQTVSGSGLFGGTVSSTTTTNDAGVINILVIENTAPGWPNIDWQIPGTIRFKGGLNLQRGKINLNGNTWILGNYTTAPTLTCPDTCGVMNGTLGRWFATGTGGTTVTAGTVPTTTTGLYPFYSSSGARRHIWLQKAGTITNNVAGELMASFSSGSPVSGVSYVDTSVTPFTVDSYNDDRWSFSVPSGSTYVHNGTHSIAFAAPGTFNPNNNNHRAMLSDGSFVGRHQNANGLPLVQRINLTTAQLTSTQGFVMGYNSTQLCAPQNQFTENFDTYATGSIVPNCWARLIVGSGSQSITTTTPSSAPNNMYQYSSSSANQSFVILPETVNLSGGTHRIRMKLRVASATISGHLEVGYITDVQDASTFTPFEVLNPTNTAYGPETYVNIPAGVPANARIAIANRGVTTASHYWDDFIFEPIPACPNPTSIAVGSITSSTAIVSWTGNSSALYYEVALQAPASGIPTGTGTLVTQASYSLSGLSPNTSYEIYVRSACGGVFSNWEGPRVFTTTCVTATIPYLRDFNTWPPSCWNLTGGTQTVSQANNDYLVASLYSWTSGNFALAATEPISISAPARLKFNWSHLYSATYPNDQMILQAQVVGTTTWDTLLNLIGPTFTTPGGANTAPAPAANFIRQSLILPQSYVGQEVTFRFRFNSGFGPHVYIDNFIVESLPPCPDPTSASAVNIGVNDATGTWSPVAGAISYEVAILPSGTGLPTGPGITTTDTFYAFSGLQPQTSYSYFVRVTCAAGVGTWYGPVTFRTLCGPVNAFFEDFEAYATGSIVPECWNRLIVGSASQTITTTTPASGIRNMYQFSSAGTASYVILPAMQNISAGTHRITVKLRMSSGVGHLEVGYLTDINDASTFTAFAVLNPANTVYGPVSIVNIPAGLPSNARIAIANRAVAASLAHYWDDLRYELLPACPEPAWLPVTATTTTGATLNWTSVAPAQSYELQVVASGSGLSGTPVAIAGGNTSYAASGLAPNTGYDAYIRAICGADTSVWYGPQEFRTQCLPVNSFYEDFETYPTGSIVPQCWNRLIVGTASQTISTLSASGGSRAIYQYSAANMASYVILPVMQNVAAGTHRIRFKARMASGVGQIDIGYLTDITDASTYVNIASIPLTSITYGPEYALPIPAGIPANARIAIANRAAVPATGFYWDELYYEPLPPCAAPGIPSFAVTGYGSGTLSWYQGGNETSWQVGYSTQGSGVPTNLSVVTSPTLAVSGLPIGAVQTAYIRSICTPDTSAWTNLDFSVNYCASNATSTIDTRITLVRLGADSVASPAAVCATYTDYSSLPPFTLRMGAPDSMTVKYGTCGGAFVSFATVYVDFNRDLVFDNATEKIFEGNCSAGIDLAGIPTLPLVSSYFGITRMRVVLRESGSTTLNLPCGTYTYGETQDFSVEIIAPSPNDIGVTNIVNPTNTCVFSAQQQVTVAITNFGTTTQSGFPVSYSLSGGAAVTEIVSDPVALGQTIQYTFNARANMYGPAVHTLRAWTSLSTDTRAANDTARKTVREAFSFSAGQDTTIALGSSVTLRSNTVQGPSGILGDLTQAAATSCGGGFMFDLRAPNANIFISGFDVLPTTAGTQTVSVYYKVGTKTGFQTNIAAWTLEGTYTINPATATSVVTMPISGFTITAGQVYGIYLQYNNRYSASGVDFSNADLVINNGEGMCTNWTTCCAPRYWRGRIYYGSNISFTWSDLTGSQLGTSDTLSVSPVTTTAYVLTGSDGTCSRSDTVVVSVAGTIQPPVSGTLRYDNTSQTPMTNTTVRLLAGGTQITSVITNATGDFNFGPVPPGSYTLQYQTNKPWGGVNSVDALNITRHFSVVQPLSGLRLRVADVNNSNSVSATDALQVNQRFSFLRSSFSSGDWAYSLTTLTVPNDPTPIVLSGRALCFGDVNGSYNPNVNLRERWEDLTQSGEVFTGEGEYTVNLQLESALNVGAVSLVLRVPAGMEVLGITTGMGSSDEVVFKQIGNVVRIAWHTLQQWDVENGGVLLRIRARGVADGGFALGAHESELANSWADVYGTFNLRGPRLVGSSANYTGVSVYPNPSASIFRVNSETAMQELVVRDMSGREVLRTLPVSGTTELDLSAQRDGVYMLEVRLSDRTEQIRLVLRR